MRRTRAVKAAGTLLAFVGMSAVAGVLVAAAVTPAVAAAGAAAQGGIGVFEGLPEYLEPGQLAQPSTIYASDGYPLATFYSQNRLPVGFEKMSQAVKDAAVAGEDPRFYEHGGVDIQGTVRGALSTVAGGGVQGGSSITQQYVKNVLLQKCEAMLVKTPEQKKRYDDCVADSTGVKPDRKLREMKYAIGIEKKYTKDQILAGYLNIAGFGGTVYGVEAAAHYYFDTTAAALTPAQAASLMAIVNEPTSLKLDDPESKTNGAANGYAKNRERRDYILGKMHEYGKLTKAQYDAAVKTPITPKITPSERGCQTAGGAAFFCDYVQRIFLTDPAFGKDQDTRAANLNRGGYKIYTSLDVGLQRVAEDTMSSYVPAVTDEADLGGVLVGVQPGTGRVLYMAQNKKYNQDPAQTSPEYTAINYATDEAYGGSNGFQVGSTYKVFTLADWLENGHSLYETVDANIRTYDQADFTDSCPGAGWTGSWQPTNDESGQTGRRNAMDATADSINSAYVAMAYQLDLCDIRKAAEAFDVHTATGVPLDTNPASVLGTNTIAPLTMATAFAGIANNGTTCSPIAIDRILDAAGKPVTPPASTCRQSVTPEVAHAMAAALKGTVDHGTASGVNGTGVDMLAKTGTTGTADGNDQIWLVAATTKIAGAYWVGNLTGHVSMRAIAPTHGTTPAAARVTVMHRVMAAAVAAYGGDDFPPPGSSATRTPTTAVPDVTGQTAERARALLEAAGFRAADGGTAASTAPAGTVVSTAPAAGIPAEDGSAVTLTLSSGPPPAAPAPTTTPAPAPAPNGKGTDR